MNFICKCRKKTFISTLILFLMISLHSNLRAEYLFLNDGSIIKCTVKTETPEQVEIIDEEGKVKKFTRDQVLRIQYANISMSKVFVQKKNGETMIVYLVNETRAQYTFRVDLYKPEEINVDRTEVLFIAERNPSGLKADPGIDSIGLTWYKSYEKMKEYRIYIRKTKEEKAHQVASVSGDSVNYVIKNLPSNSKYYITITGLDDKKDETGPSNEVEIMTKNFPPAAPASVVKKKTDDGSLSFSWSKAEDVDGTVQKYRIYSYEGLEKKNLSETGELSFTMKDIPDNKKIYITAVDDREDESPEAQFKFYDRDSLLVSVAPGLMIPLSSYSDIAGMGYGALFSIMKRSLFVRSLEIGIEGGFYYLPGVNSLDTYYQKTETFLFFPLSLFAGYRFYISDDFSISPRIASGGAMMIFDYIKRDKYTLEDKAVKASSYGPVLSAGVSAGYRLTDTIYLTLGGSAGMLPGADAGLFVTCEFGMMYRLF